jgi:D-alanyl-D-alanine carboxypeptidase
MGPPTLLGTTVRFPATTKWTSFDQVLIQGLLNRGDVTVSVAVADHGVLVHTAIGGTVDKDTGAPATVESRLQIASNSKVLTGTVVMELVEQGTLRLDQPVLDIVAHKLGVTMLDQRMRFVTVKQLLSHTSGFGFRRPLFFGGEVDSCQDAARNGLTHSLEHPPGVNYLYSNMNFCILGLLIEAITGMPYQQAIKDRLLTPLNITDMRIAGTYDLQPGDVHHQAGPDRKYMEALGPAGAWIGTPADLVRIVDSLDDTLPGFHPLLPATVALMRTPLPIAYIKPGDAYGLALRLWSDGTWGHTGTIENAHSMVIHRDDGITWALMINGNSPSVTDTIRKVVDAAFATMSIRPPPADPTVYTVPPPLVPTAPPAQNGPTTAAPATTGPPDEG